MPAPPGLRIPYNQGPPPNPPTPHEPNALPPIVEGPALRDAPPDGRQSYNLVVGTTPIRLAPKRTWRQGCLLYNEDFTNSIRYGEDAASVSGTTAQPMGALLPAEAAVILRSSREIWAVAVAGTPTISVTDEWYAAPPQRQPMGI